MDGSRRDNQQQRRRRVSRITESVRGTRRHPNAAAWADQSRPFARADLELAVKNIEDFLYRAVHMVTRAEAWCSDELDDRGAARRTLTGCFEHHFGATCRSRFAVARRQIQ